MEDRNRKPLGGKAYGSISHLPGSRLGPGDHQCHEGKAVICTIRARDRHDRIIVQEKLDGSCVAVAKVDNRIIPLTRAGYPAHTSPWEFEFRFRCGRPVAPPLRPGTSHKGLTTAAPAAGSA